MSAVFFCFVSLCSFWTRAAGSGGRVVRLGIERERERERDVMMVMNDDGRLHTHPCVSLPA